MNKKYFMSNRKASWDACTNYEQNEILMKKYERLLDDLSHDD